MCRVAILSTVLSSTQPSQTSSPLVGMRFSSRILVKILLIQLSSHLESPTTMRVTRSPASLGTRKSLTSWDHLLRMDQSLSGISETQRPSLISKILTSASLTMIQYPESHQESKWRQSTTSSGTLTSPPNSWSPMTMSPTHPWQYGIWDTLRIIS